MGQRWKLQLPLGIADPIFMCELALEMGMPLGELGSRMSNHELTVIWPAYFAMKDREAARERSEADMRRGRI